MAEALYKQVLKNRPDSPQDQVALAENQIVMTVALIAAGRLADAQATAERLPAIMPGNPNLYVRAAAQLIACAEAAPGTPEGQRLSEDSLSRAVAVLRAGVSAKAIQSPKSLDVSDFVKLRDRTDFKAVRDSILNSGSPG
jgi:hypothetical protein